MTPQEVGDWFGCEGKKKGNLFLRFWLIPFFGRKKKRIMFSERKGIWLFLFSKEKKGNLFLRFWLILFSEKNKKGFYFMKEKKKLSFVLRILLFLFLEKK